MFYSQYLLSSYSVPSSPTNFILEMNVKDVTSNFSRGLRKL